MRLPTLVTFAVAALASTASAAFLHRGSGMEVGPIDPTTETLNKRAETAGFNGWGTFDQLIDHDNPKLGTFKQRYWYGTEFWKGPGSPIFLVNPGEQAATNFNKTYTTSQRLAGLFAQTMGGAVVIVEHRYWGESSPYSVLTVQNLTYLTLENSIRDMTYFARNFVPPFDTTGKSAPTEAPWVFSGGSYSGALAAWVETIDPGTLWAYHGTSGVVEAVGDFWQYFVPVQEATPANCSRDLSSVIDYIDATLVFGTPKAKRQLKDKFMLGDLTDADFASALENGPWMWQSTQFYSEKTLGYNLYYQFCDYIENVFPNTTNPKIPSAKGVGVAKALDGYAKWVKEVLIPGNCESAGYSDWQGEFNTQCFRNQNTSNVAFNDLSVGNWVNRQWNWMLCNEPFEYWQDGAPLGRPSIVSRLVTADYWRQQCASFFPPSQGGTYGIKQGKRARDVNKWTGGWYATNSTRLMHANGQLDPWRDATVSSVFRPGGPLKSTEKVPVRVIKGGTHCSDLYGQNWPLNADVRRVVDEEVENMKTWVGEFYTINKKTRPS
ncbi:serine-type peptidase-like protein [Apodospora peruviana]|uniref:Serine-type peptidase-like protein n=1 Tax=Apodospora peruviana TaxID=516989 RepID=A0AAE0M2Z6_9PEZI|nr:serine-type peptidase-like protein [Apodospora peruviana]